jgi:predicted double-glycine peptidase
MSNAHENLTLLNVPYFQQTRTATCGPACLMMVMKYWDPSLEFSRRFEFQLWRRSFSFFLFGGTFQFGLAAAAVKLDFKTEIYQKTRFSDAYPKFPQLAHLIENIVSHKTRRIKIPIQYGKDIIVVIRNSLRKKIPPIVFVNLKPILGENVFHWFVVTGLDEQNVYINDPYIPLGCPLKIKKEYPITLDIFNKAIATESGRNLRLPSCVVLVYK